MKWKSWIASVALLVLLVNSANATDLIVDIQATEVTPPVMGINEPGSSDLTANLVDPVTHRHEDVNVISWSWYVTKVEKKNGGGWDTKYSASPPTATSSATGTDYDADLSPDDEDSSTLTAFFQSYGVWRVTVHVEAEYEELEHPGIYHTALGDTTVDFKVAKVGLTPYRGGDYFGMQESLEDQQSNDPKRLLLLTDNNRDIDPAGDTKDKDQTSVPVDGSDPDLVQLVIRIDPSISTGTVTISSPPSSIRLLDKDGATLSNYSVNLSSPSGALADLATTGSVSVWAQGLTQDSDYDVNVYYSSGGSPSGTPDDQAHILVVEHVIKNGNDDEVESVPVTPQEHLVYLSEIWTLNDATTSDKPVSPPPDPQIEDKWKYKIHYSGLPTDIVLSVTISSDSSDDTYEDTFETSASETVSEDFGSIYLADNTYSLSLPEDKDTILSELGIHILDAESTASLELRTQHDQYTRRLSTVRITSEDTSTPPCGGRIVLNFDPSAEFTFNAEVGPDGGDYYWEIITQPSDATVTNGSQSDSSFYFSSDTIGVYVIRLTYTRDSIDYVTECTVELNGNPCRPKN